mmetsp:Transcript_21465/g.49134  ORF Transcript_21465/g.49134 Transcript_21465/m.49134 type:complete len:89 (-) Transcript_21465:251-517(-)
MPRLAGRRNMDFDILHGVNALSLNAKWMSTVLRRRNPAEPIDLQICLRVSPASVGYAQSRKSSEPHESNVTAATSEAATGSGKFDDDV